MHVKHKLVHILSTSAMSIVLSCKTIGQAHFDTDLILIGTIAGRKWPFIYIYIVDILVVNFIHLLAKQVCYRVSIDHL